MRTKATGVLRWENDFRLGFEEWGTETKYELPEMSTLRRALKERKTNLIVENRTHTGAGVGQHVPVV